MTPEQQKEEISKAYIHAVAARCGFAVAYWSQDHGRIDMTLSAGGVVGSGLKARPKLDLQLKCTGRQDLSGDGFVSWTLERDHYDDLRRCATTPHILVVLLLPADMNDWISHTNDQLILRRCAFWLNLSGMDPRETDTVTVRVPLTQPFSPDQLAAMMARVSAGAEP